MSWAVTGTPTHLSRAILASYRAVTPLGNFARQRPGHPSTLADTPNINSCAPRAEKRGDYPLRRQIYYRFYAAGLLITDA